GTIGIPLAAPPRTPVDFDPQAAQLTPSRPATQSPLVAESQADIAPPLRPATRQVIRPATVTAAIAPPSETPLFAEPLVAEAPPVAPREPDPSLAFAGSEFGQLVWRRSVLWVRGHRTAVAAVGGLIAFGVVLGVVLAQFAGRSGGASFAAALPATPK